jgi:hypothetical protein
LAADESTAGDIAMKKIKTFTSGWDSASHQTLTLEPPRKPLELTLKRCLKAPELNNIPPREALVIESFYSLEEKRRSGAHKAWLSFDDSFLHAVFCVSHPMPDIPELDTIIHRENISSSDSAEIFIGPADINGEYILFILGANGKTREISCHPAKGHRSTKFTGAIQTEAGMTSLGWSARASLPLELFKPFINGGAARFNLCVNIARPDLGADGAWTGSCYDQFSMTELSRSFHEPEHFAVLKGLPLI